jgi:hypothetical protein
MVNLFFGFVKLKQINVQKRPMLGRPSLRRAKLEQSAKRGIKQTYSLRSCTKTALFKINEKKLEQTNSGLRSPLVLSEKAHTQ